MDVAIAILLASIQLGLAFLGWKVSVQPLRTTVEEKLYGRIFASLGVIGIALVGWSTWRADASQSELKQTQAELRSELRVVTGADNFVYLRPLLDRRTESGFQLTVDGRGAISGGLLNIVPATALDASHEDYRKGLGALEFLALHAGMDLNASLPIGAWRIEFVSLTTGHYNQFVEIAEVDGKPIIRDLRVIRGTKQLYP